MVEIAQGGQASGNKNAFSCLIMHSICKGSLGMVNETMAESLSF